MIAAPQITPQNGGSRVAVLDGLRAVAILSVMAFHYTIRWAPPHAGDHFYPYHDFFAHLPILRSFLNYGWAGVELFFVISGFVICMTLERSNGFLDFARRRLARLWPAMLVCASITMAVAQFGPAPWRVGPMSFLSSILFLDPKWFGLWFHLKGLGWVDGVYWTLWIEVRFYIMAALLFALCKRRFLWALTVVMAVSFVAGLKSLHYREQALAWDLLLCTFLPYFVFGVGVYRLNAVGRITLETAAAIAVSTLIIFAQGWLSFEYPAGGPIGFLVVNVLIIAAFGLFVMGSPLVRPFGWRPLVRLGEASYSLYLIHSLVGIVMIERLSALMPWPVAILTAALSMVALSLALFRWVETPGKRLILSLTAQSRLPFKVPRIQGPGVLRLALSARARAEALPPTIANG